MRILGMVRLSVTVKGYWCDARNNLSKVGKQNKALERVNKRAEFERAKLAEFCQREQSLKD
jgi:hypothetical protein